MEESTFSLRRLTPLLLAVLLVLVISSFMNNRGSVKPDTSTYQAVFLTNKDSYFGKLTNVSGEYVIMTDIYYLKKNPKQAEDAPPLPPFSLTKFGIGQELYGPEDEIQIAKEQIVLWENLRPDSPIVKNIAEHKKQAQAGASTAPNPAPSGSSQ